MVVLVTCVIALLCYFCNFKTPNYFRIGPQSLHTARIVCRKWRGAILGLENASCAACSTGNRIVIKFDFCFEGDRCSEELELRIYPVDSHCKYSQLSCSLFLFPCSSHLLLLFPPDWLPQVRWCYSYSYYFYSNTHRYARGATSLSIEKAKAFREQVGKDEK